MKKHKFKILLLVCFTVFSAKAQTVLTVDEAIKIALENNFDIRIAANDLKIDKTNVTIGNAGILPTVTANVVDNNGIQNSKQTRSDGTVNELDNAKNNSLNYGVGLNWTIFDGLGMFARYDQLKELQKLGEAELRLSILTSISDVISTYYNIAQQQQQLSALDSTIVISKQRLELANNRYTIGKASKLEVLNAQVDLNTDTTNLLRQKELYANTKIAMNQILARDPQTDFIVENEIVIDRTLQLGELTALAQKQNPQLEAQVINKRVSELQLKQIKANRYPVIGINTGYNFARTESSLGFTTQTSANGLTYGFTASMNIFDGFNQNRSEKVARLQVQNSQLLIEQQTENIKSQLASAFQTYLTNIELADLEQKNEEIAKQNLDITMEKFRIGTIPTIEFRTAQLNYITAQTRNNDAQFQAKLSEIALKELAGNLKF
ncbi:MAG: transporter [Flavobacterium sp. BFFFF1]|uniref:TolC family protein n=1 Tax=Flavobacterium sp. BFFFF1 TaxID=2015557 RepID=UPI000BCC34F0|nr:TolC family protein [Flavobacterium sp. BFFFF1]OYU79243.1 MAG: transporter [Flavobacterium sp. BFFFF1]